jgi:hypothetical protein
VSPSDQPETIFVVYFPYLPLRERTRVGNWEVLPKAELTERDCQDGRCLELAGGLGKLYVLPGDAQGAAGAFVRSQEGRIGDDPGEPERLQDLYRAWVVTVLDGNESPLLPLDERDPNAAHYALTSDNAQLVAHGINREHGFTAAVSGSRVRYRSLGIPVLGEQPGIPRMTFPPPADLRIPFGRTVLDAEYADATWQSIRRGSDEARQLARAIDWLALAWLNLTALSDDIRIPTLRAGFEVLLDSDDYIELARRLARLLKDESEGADRTWTSRAGTPVTKQVTDVAWWFVRFSFLRNALMHGRLPERQDWLHDDRNQTDLGEWYLRDAIKHTVALDDHKEILEKLRWRAFSREARRLWEELHGEASD